MKPLAMRCLELTSTIETGKRPPACYGVTAGDHDGQGMSFGALQFAAKPGSLGPILRYVDEHDRGAFNAALGDIADACRAAYRSPAALAEWARSIQSHKSRSLYPKWAEAFARLGALKSCQDAQLDASKRRYQKAIALCTTYGLWSERGVAAMFDLVVQHGSIPAEMHRGLLDEFAAEYDEMEPSEREEHRLLLIGRRRASYVRTQYRDRVLSRREALARGHGEIHGTALDMDKEFGIGLREAVS